MSHNNRCAQRPLTRYSFSFVKYDMSLSETFYINDPNLLEESEFGKRRAQNADLWNKTFDPPKRPKFPSKGLCKQRQNNYLHVPQTWF